MKLEYYTLGLLEIKPLTGYDIKKFLDTEGRFGRKRAPLSQIYNTLKRMLEQEWVEFEEVKREGKPDVKIYQREDKFIFEGDFNDKSPHIFYQSLYIHPDYPFLTKWIRPKEGEAGFFESVNFEDKPPRFKCIHEGMNLEDIKNI